MDESKEKLIRFFRDTNLVSTEKSEEFALHFQRKYVRKNDFFLREGQISDEYLFLEEGCTETAEERYANLLVTHPEIFVYSPLKNIATFLGITDTSLSRIRKEFSKK
jgi:hypothetical protein